MILHDKPNLTYDCDGPILKPFTGVCMTTMQTNFGDLKELPPGTLIFPEESPYLNNANKHTFVCTYFDAHNNTLSGYCVDDHGKNLTPKLLYPEKVCFSLNTENETLKNEIKRLAPFIGTTNFKNLVEPDNDLYLGKSFTVNNKNYVKTPVPGLYEVTTRENPQDKNYNWLEKDNVKFLNEHSQYGIIPSNKQYEPDGSSLEKFTAILSKAVQNYRIQDETLTFGELMETTINKDFTDYISKNSHEEACDLLDYIITDNKTFYEIEALKSTGMSVHIYDGDEQLTGKINLVRRDLGGGNLILPASYSISEKDLENYFDLYEPFDPSEMTGLEIESEQITASDFELQPDKTEFATSKENVTLDGVEYAFGETFYNATIVKDSQVDYLMCTLKQRLQKDPDNDESIERFTKQMDICSSSHTPIGDFLDLKDYDPLLNERIIKTLNSYTKAHDEFISEHKKDLDIAYSPVLLDTIDEATHDDYDDKELADNKELANDLNINYEDFEM